jgi:GNAT superfamily N-acetyltransferase
VTPPAHRVEPLTKTHERSEFRCGSDALDRYLAQQAHQDAEKQVAAPFVLVSPPSPAVLGYYTLSASLIKVGDIDPNLAKKLPRYLELPVTRIGRLAVDVALKGQGSGAFLLMDALHRSLTHAAQIAAMAVVVDAKDEAASAFYRRFDFVHLQTNSRRLYIPMKTVATLFP